MTDEEVKQLDQLFDKKISTLTQRTESGFADLTKIVEHGFATVTAQIDTVARHLAIVHEKVTGMQTTQSEHSDQLGRIERRLNQDLDRLDDHGTRIETLEAKAGHLPTPPRS